MLHRFYSTRSAGLTIIIVFIRENRACGGDAGFWDSSGTCVTFSMVHFLTKNKIVAAL
jgi:hypothetical protein